VRAAYTGHEPLMFPDYTDLETGQTLRAEPGGVYDVAPASGRDVPEVPVPWFVPVVVSSEPIRGSMTDLFRKTLEPEPEPEPESIPEG